MLNQGNHHSIHLQRAWNKYGESVFDFTVLENVEEKLKLIEREQHYLDELQPFGKRGFNIAQIAGSTLGVKRTPEQIERMASFHRGKKISQQHKDAISRAIKGRKHSEASKQKMREAKLANNPQVGRPLTEKQKQALHKKGREHVWWGKKHSDKTKKKISESKRVPVLQIISDGFGVYWPSATLAASQFNLKGTETIYRACSDPNRRAAGFGWRRIASSMVVS